MKLPSLETRLVSLLSLVLALTTASQLLAAPLNPNAFTSLGANPFTLAGTYTINTAGATPVLTRPDASTVNGVVSGGIAVFTFNNISIAAGMTVNGVQNAGSRPLALLSQGGLTNAGTLNVSGANGGVGEVLGGDGSGGDGGNAGPGGGGGGGGGGAGLSSFGPAGGGGLGFVNGANGNSTPDTNDGGNGGSVEAGGGGLGGGGTPGPAFTDGGGGAFGGNGGDGGIPGFGGTNYGNLAQTLEGGSGGAGGNGSDHFGGSGGGGGGGAVELGVSGNITLTGSVLANGGTSGGDDLGGDFFGGGGAGGGIFVHAQTVSLSGNLNAGGGGSIAGGGGGGGRVLILTANGALASGSLAANVNVSGGTTQIGSGQSGVKALSGLPISVTVNTSPAGRGFSVDGTNYTSAQNFTWAGGSSHTIATTSPQAGSPGTQFVFNNWSDGGAMSHGVTAPATNITYTANFTTQYQLTIATNPPGGGTVTPASGNFYNAATIVNLQATANSNYYFSSWSGNVASFFSAFTTVAMSGPQFVAANFSPKVQSTTTLTPSVTNIFAGQSASLRAAISSPPPDDEEDTALAPTGTMRFFEVTGGSSNLLAALPVTFLTNAVGAILTTNYPVGTHSVIAVYSGSSYFLPSTSAVAMVNVQCTGPTNYTLIGPPGSVLSTMTNGLPLLTVFVPLGQCQTNISYDEIKTDCNGTTTNHLQYTVKVGEMFDPHRTCHTEFDQFGNPITVCSNAYFLTAVDPFAPPLYSIINNSDGSVLSRTNGLPLLIVTADPGQCSASVAFDVVRAASCEGPGRTNHITTSVEVGAKLDPERWRTCHTEFDQFGNPITVCYFFLLTAIDAERPTITCPGNITSNAAPGQSSAVVTFAPSIHDNCDTNPTVICTPPSGSTFSGVTPVTCTAIDASGNSNSCTFTVTVLANQCPTAVAKVSPLVLFPGISNNVAIAIDNSEACVVFDGTMSSDPDNDLLIFRWTEPTNPPFATSVTTTNCFGVGSHFIVLSVSDTNGCTAATNLTLEVISPCMAVGLAIECVDNSSLARNRKRPLIASLKAACESFEDGKIRPGLNQLEAFQNKVRAQVAPSDPALAEKLSKTVQAIIDAINPPPLPPCLPAPSSIIGWWPADGNANDIVNGNHGILNNGTTFTTGKVGPAFTFDGVDDIVRVSTTGFPIGNGDRTHEFWVRVNEFLPVEEAFFAGYGNFGNDGQTYHVGTSLGRLFFSQWGGAIFGPQLRTNEWYHVAVSSVGNSVTLYLNGSSVGSDTFNINTPAGTEMYFGRIPGELGDTRRLRGAIDEVTIYNRALSAAEIRAIYNAGSGGKCK